MSGARRGRKRQCPDEVLDYVVDLHLAGIPLRELAARLNSESVPTPSGGTTWSHKSVDGLLHTHDGMEFLEKRAARNSQALTDGAESRRTVQVGETEKAAAYCRSEKTLRPGRPKNSSPTEADAATSFLSPLQHRTTRRHETGISAAELCQRGEQLRVVGALFSSRSAGLGISCHLPSHGDPRIPPGRPRARTRGSRCDALVGGQVSPAGGAGAPRGG
ncbi:hypothetical protein D6M20_02535 (plasmid) [Rhodococcus qingshengii]|nr:hypothetical protein D6M20_02535 [Rhodococcus qingshengii]